jgi:hypothetical protein
MMWCVRKYWGVVWIGVACSRPRRLGPAETAEVEHEQDRECRENEDTGENVVGFKELRHG